MNDIELPKEFSFFQFDEYDLVKEWKDQPRIFLAHALKLAEARADYERAKANRDEVTASLDKKIREDPSLYDLPKATETSISNTILLQKEYKVANSKVIEAKFEMDKLQAIVESLEHRKKGLEKAVDLLLMGYFAEPKTTIPASKEKLDEISKKKTARKFITENTSRRSK